MLRGSLNDLAVFAAVAEAKSFTRAARQLGLSTSALSHAMRSLEERLAVRLLTRTTRSVSATEAGERLLAMLKPALADIDRGLTALRSSRDIPAGRLRVTAVKHAVTSILMPLLPTFTQTYPAIRVEIDVDDTLVDIVAAGYDVGIRFGGKVDDDMVAVRVGQDIGVAVVASPQYLATRSLPVIPTDLTEHRCIVHRRADGSLYSWPFQDQGRSYQLRLGGSIAFNDSDLVLNAALIGQGIACVFEDAARPYVKDGRLVSLLPETMIKIPGYHLYYPSRKRNPPALAVLIKALVAQAN